MRVSTLLTNHIENPLGFELGTIPRLSWVIEDAGAADHTLRSRVEVSLEPDFAHKVWDSGFLGDLDKISYPLPLAEWRPRTRYYWRVTAQADAEQITSDIAWFETAKLDEGWQARWISPDFDPAWHPVLFTGFQVTRKVVQARVYVCGLGLYQLSLNGKQAGAEALSPGLCAYDKWLPYQTFDVTEQVKAGQNSLEAALGNGWYKGRYVINPNREFHYGEEFALLAELRIRYDDGSEDVIATNPETWKARRSPIVASSIFDGETRDDTLAVDAEYAVKPAISPATLEARRAPGIKIMGHLKPVEIIKTPAGETVLDMGQNMVGWLSFTNYAPRGAELYLQFGEILQQGNFYRDNLRTARAEFRYTSDGTQKTITPCFTFYGFRYVRLTQWHGPINIDDFTGLVLYSEMRPTGTIQTGNAKVNKLFENTLWGQRGNYLDVPTDCPQRDERMGWTGDAEMFCGTAAFNFDVNAFFHKYCYDLYQEQKALGGTVPVVVPKHEIAQTGACAWGDAATIIPWKIYVQYGDQTILEQQYESMKGWVDHIKRHDEQTGATRLWRDDFHYGDWLSLDVENPVSYCFGGTERVYLASCYYRYSAQLVAKAARVLGKADDAAYYEKLSGEVRDAIVHEYVTATGRLALNTQTAYILALFMDIIPEQWWEQTAYTLRLKLKESNYHLRTGFIGTPFLCRVLSENGGNDIAYRLLLQEDFPSWLYEVNMGATTIWERWNSVLPDGSISDTGMNSLNHYAYGSIVEWLYRNAAGIQPLEAHPGFRRFCLAPQPNRRLGSLKAEFHAPTGLIKSAWAYLESGELELRFTVPSGAVAELSLPEYSGADGAERELAPGDHYFCYLPESVVKPRFNFDTPLSELGKYPEVTKVLQKEFPDLTGMMLFSMMGGERSLNDFVREGFITVSVEEADTISARLTAASRI
jgi:alpha-L-rhamnosidase